MLMTLNVNLHGTYRNLFVADFSRDTFELYILYYIILNICMFAWLISYISDYEVWNQFENVVTIRAIVEDDRWFTFVIIRQ